MNTDIPEAICMIVITVIVIWLSFAAFYESYNNSKRKEKK